MIEILNKHAELRLSISYLKIFKRNFVFDISQATLEELIKFNYFLQKDLEFIEHIFTILNRINPKFKKRHFNKISLDEFAKITKFIETNYCRGFYNTSKEKGGGSQNEIPFNAIIKYVISNSNETLSEVKRMTWEEIKFLIDGTIYWENEKTSKGKLINKTNLLKQKTGDIDIDLTKIKKDRKKVTSFLKNNL